jgi:hypothetical protein
MEGKNHLAQLFQPTLVKPINNQLDWYVILSAWRHITASEWIQTIGDT